MSFEQTTIIAAGAAPSGPSATATASRTEAEVTGPRGRPDRPVPGRADARADQGPLRGHDVKAALHE
ncbi:hypothetical protein [Nonomuraea sp. NEAU-A123]|uniref:hypothetical protein n=1 Tax=Nonomuraea sp. NEAU-A123 TaxID=2839649 RepID=UPI001BE46969|nr:hypothetical protein [Nonomuraea sp. NEAU-A123]MBT2225156.1 hypothetical protein [Nonomuraea sp. NEAU-A123]